MDGVIVAGIDLADQSFDITDESGRHLRQRRARHCQHRCAGLHLYVGRHFCFGRKSMRAMKHLLSSVGGLHRLGPPALLPHRDETCVTVYHFHHWHGEQLIEDVEGVACASLAAARKTAIDGARDVVAGDIRDGRLDLNQRLELVDDAGRLCLIIPFCEAVQVIAPSLAAAQLMIARGANGKAMHALIIDDETLIAMCIEDVLRDLGYQTFAIAETEEDAVVAASIARPDLTVSRRPLGRGQRNQRCSENLP